MQSLLPSHCQAAPVSVVQAKKGQTGYFKAALTSPLTGGAVGHHQGPGPHSSHISSKPPCGAGATLYLWLFCSWQGPSVAAVEGIHTHPHGLIPTRMGDTVALSSASAAASPQRGTWHGRDTRSDGAIPHLEV